MKQQAPTVDTAQSVEAGIRASQQFSITLPNELASWVQSMVTSGVYATESEVFRASLQALMAREQATERWLQEQVGPAYDALEADPFRTVSPGRVRARIAAEHKKLSDTQACD